MNLKKMGALVLAGVLAATLLSVVSPVQTATAADGALFEPGNIISDAVFFDGQSMDAGAVQSFLSAKVPNCRAGYTCLKDYSQDTPSRAAVSNGCTAYAGRANESAAAIIARVGVACGISPKAMIVLIEKEQGLISDTWPSARQYRSATGYGCPDTADCDATYYGFFNQVYAAALQFKYYAANPTRWNHVPGRNNEVRYNPNVACGSGTVFIQNQATAGLYNYTPYQPNAAALGNLYGTGDGCSSYGNRNFWRMFTDWFGSPTMGTSLLRTVADGTVYLVSGNSKYPVPSIGILIALAPLGTVGYVSQSYLDRFTTAHTVGRSLRANDGTIYFYDSGIKLPFASCGQATDYGASCAASGYVQLTDAQIAAFYTGPILRPVLGTVEGSRYYIKNGTKAEILDDQSQAAAGIPAGMNVLTENAVSALSLVAPVVRDGAFAKARSTSNYSLLAAGKRYGMAAGAESSLGVVTRTTGSLSSTSMGLIPASAASFTGVFTAGGAPPAIVVNSEGRYALTAGGLTAISVPVAVPQALIDTYPDKGTIAAGSFIKSPNAADVFVVMPTDIRPISGWGALLALTPDGNPVITTVAPSVIASLTQGPVALTAGTLVRSPENATVYFIDGVTSRIAFTSFIFPLEAGFGDLVFSTEQRIQAYPLGAKLMTFGLSCGADLYVAAGGQVHRVDPSKAALYPFDYVPMDQFTCGQMKEGAAAPTFIRTPDGGIYQLVAGQKRPVASMARLGQIIGTETWLDVVPAFAAVIPTGPLA
ncbi:hypothetical protein QMG61_14110 [Cryobacterium sp. PH31-AA6]|uniref:hypothetical protein n=1 Tax=Cryobacterium sp. PH31-AA6 TaxID=3046205 RepID=UPI0024B9FA93|nr:hypothetical protein [Cryobacterium sp. PH31-AA6]MDJ0324894.1 hypothetical protein [Cryobacterium sp. PH31-AA6]